MGTCAEPGCQAARETRSGVGCTTPHAAVDDRVRLAHTEILAHEQKQTCWQRVPCCPLGTPLWPHPATVTSPEVPKCVKALMSARGVVDIASRPWPFTAATVPVAP